MADVVKCDRCGKPVGKAVGVRIESVPKKLPKDPAAYKPKIKFRHEECHEKVEFETSGFNDLYDYLQETYFIKIVPPFLIAKLREFRKFYTFQEMHECLTSLEEKIKKHEKKDVQHRCSSLMFFLKNHIEDYQKQKMLLRVQQAEISDYTVITYDKVKKELTHWENYDILDEE